MSAPLPAERSNAWVERLSRSESPAFTTRRARRAETSGAPHDPIVWAEAAGVNVLDVDGNRYVDLTAGFGVAALGHNPPTVVDAACTQARRLTHALGDLHPSDVKVELLERLRALVPFDARVALSLTGSDAIEIALKTAHLATGRPGVLAFEGGYHGLSYGALSACGYSPRFRDPFASQLSRHVTFAPFPKIDRSVDAALAAVAAVWPEPAPGAIVIEPVQARGGVRIPPPGFLDALAEWSHERGALVVVDEIFTGFGRCGSLLRSLAEACDADLLCVGKALGGGFPVSACIGRSDVMRAWGNPNGAALHTGTFFGHPVGCAAALASLERFETERVCEQSARTGARLLEALAPLRALPNVVDVRGPVCSSVSSSERPARRCARFDG